MADTLERLSKGEFEPRAEELRVRLLDLQAELRERADFPVVIELTGDDRLGVHRLLNRLNEWLDPRYIHTTAYSSPATEAERLRPQYWRYWRDLPPKGQIGLFLRSWTVEAIVDRLLGETSKKGFQKEIERASRFEHLLEADGALLLTIGVHLSKKEHRQLLKEAKKDPVDSFLIGENDELIAKEYDTIIELLVQCVAGTDTPRTPWVHVAGSDERRCDLDVGTAIADRIEERLRGYHPPAANSEGPASAPSEPAAPAESAKSAKSAGPALDDVDLTRCLDASEYRDRRDLAQAKLYELTLDAARQDTATILVFQGWDAAGKGGAIRRVSAAIDAALVKVVRVGAPTEEERRYHYLWRFWRAVPRAGRVVMFDRSWYGRLMVERIEGFATEPEWRRAYDEIVDFEDQLVRHGTVVQKFWLHISAEEQLARFEERERTEHKCYKITKEDWRNREKRPEYIEAVNEMLTRTHTKKAPWHVIAANDKRSARVEVLETIVEALESKLR